MNPAPLAPNIPNATQTIAADDVPAFWDAIIAVLPLPSGKTVDKITGFHVTQVRDGASLAVNMTFKA